ncbi:MAG: Gfo/Idh/MocA family oxidoreductase [Niabella sp.]
MPSQKQIKVAVAGVGFIGPVHIESLRRLPGIEVASICHSNEKAARQKAAELFIPNYYSDFEKMLSEVELDCIHICTPNDLHYHMAKTALLAGKHVVCDKPLAMTVTEAKELLELAKARNLVHAVNFNIRYYPLVRQMKRIREKGALGDVYSIIGSYLQDWLFYNTDYNWRVEAAKTGDSKAIADIGSHLIDLIEYITGLQVEEVMADFSTIHHTRKKPLKNVDTYSGKILSAEDYIEVPVNVEDHATVLLRFNNGRKGSATVSQVAAGRKNRLNIEISGSKCTLAWCSERPNDLFTGKRDEPNQLLMRDPALTDDDVKNIISYPGGHNEGFGDTSKQLFKEIYADVRNGTPSAHPSYPTFEHGLRELIICESIVQSNKLQQWVKV